MAKKHWTQTPSGRKTLARKIANGTWGRKRKTTKPAPVKFKKPARVEVLELAKVGARVRLAEIDREREKLLIFLDEKHDA